MISLRLLRIVTGVVMIFLASAPAFSQGTFAVGSVPATGADIGIAELTGHITLTVASGTTIAAPFLITYSAPITNNSADEIQVFGSGGLAGIAAAPTLAGTNAILINVPAGGGLGDLIRIQGVRVALADYDHPTVTATVTGVSSPGNAIIAGQTVATVIGNILAPLAVDTTVSDPLSYVNGRVTNGTSRFLVKEGFAGAFSNGVGVYGQTKATRIRITPLLPLPAGAKVTFSAGAPSGTGISLETLSGEDETVPRTDGSTDVTYELAASPDPGSVESFEISVAITADPLAGTGTITFQAALVPIGIVVPDQDYPSTDIPRYLERKVPEDVDLPGLPGTVELAFPVRALSDGVYTGIALTNPLDYRVKVTLTPYNAAGGAVAEPITITLPANGQVAQLPTDAAFFGPGLDRSGAGTIKAVGQTPILPGFYLQGDVSGSRLDGATAEMTSYLEWVWPVVSHQTPAPFTDFEMYNPGTLQANVSLGLFDSNGTAVDTASLTLPASGTAIRSFSSLFPQTNLAALAGGYVKGKSDVALVARETFGNSLDSNVIKGQAALLLNTFYLPHFASGGGYTTELTLVNLDTSIDANLTLTLYDNDANRLGNPLRMTIQPARQTIATLANLFPALGTATGYIRVDVEPSFKGPFAFTPPITGCLRFSAADGSGSSALSLVNAAYTDFVYSHVAGTAGYYTGVAALNTSSSADALITLDVYDKTGHVVGSYSTSLLPGRKLARLLTQMVPATAGQSGGFIRIRSNLPVVSFAVFASFDGKSLSAIPPQGVGN